MWYIVNIRKGRKNFFDLTSANKTSLMRLEEHGYVIKDGEGWKIRVPLFEKWLREYADSFA
jgi:hypothetical protein